MKEEMKRDLSGLLSEIHFYKLKVDGRFLGGMRHFKNCVIQLASEDELVILKGKGFSVKKLSETSRIDIFIGFEQIRWEKNEKGEFERSTVPPKGSVLKAG